MRGILEMGDQSVREIMSARHRRDGRLHRRPRSATRCVWSPTPASAASRSTRTTSITSFGVVYAKDLIAYLQRGDVAPALRDVARPPYFVPETKRANELLADLRREQVHMAIAVDEYGGTAGVVTVEDLVEEIVGEISDEHDTDEIEVERISGRRGPGRRAPLQRRSQRALRHRDRSRGRRLGRGPRGLPARTPRGAGRRDLHRRRRPDARGHLDPGPAHQAGARDALRRARRRRRAGGGRGLIPGSGRTLPEPEPPASPGAGHRAAPGCRGVARSGRPADCRWPRAAWRRRGGEAWRAQARPGAAARGHRFRPAPGDRGIAHQGAHGRGLPGRGLRRGVLRRAHPRPPVGGGRGPQGDHRRGAPARRRHRERVPAGLRHPRPGRGSRSRSCAGSCARRTSSTSRPTRTARASPSPGTCARC